MLPTPRFLPPRNMRPERRDATADGVVYATLVVDVRSRAITDRSGQAVALAAGAGSPSGLAYAGARRLVIRRQPNRRS
jgi:hypothetical protein